MYRIPIKRLIVALALALQTLASAAGAGWSRLPAAEGPSGGVYCEQNRGGSDRRSQPVGGHGRDASACLSCQACLAGFSPIPAHLTGACPLMRRHAARAEWTPVESLVASSAQGPSNRARAPPGFV